MTKTKSKMAAKNNTGLKANKKKKYSTMYFHSYQNGNNVLFQFIVLLLF